MKLLLVEDNDLDVFMLQRLLRRMSLDLPIIRAANGEEALAILRPPGSEPALRPPFIMILDINMPRMNGFELLDELGDDDILSQVPVYVVSTSTRPQDRERAMQYRIRDYVVKPITETVLREMLDLPGDDTGCTADA
ncbi:MAG: response regulator [Granulosicoccus sp.]|nr:response regulator [Granulosicoccus sp.]